MAKQTKYAVLIDAGSSGSRVYVYEWVPIVDPAEMHNTKIDTVPGYTSKKVNPGIATLAPVLAPVKAVDLDAPVHISEQLPQASAAVIAAETLDRVKKYLGPLLDHARAYVPSMEIKNIPLFIMATGGMRRIELAQYDAYQVLLNAIKIYLSSTPFKDPMFATISGEDEAMYGWVAANFVDKAFKPGGTPHGFMELGGESAQFAVSLKIGGGQGDYKGPLRLLKIWDKYYTIYVKTWMGIGNDSAWKRHLEKLRASDSAMPLDPCVPKGYSYRLSGCDKIVVGEGDFQKCLKEALSLLDCPDPACRNGDLCIYRCQAGGDPESVGCLLRDRETGHPVLKFDKEKFSGASVYWHATHGIFRRPGDSVKEDFTAFWDTVVQYSRMDWETLKAHKPGERGTDYKFLRRGFFTAAMVMSTLFLGFGVPMPPEAVQATREFAKERVNLAKIAAENAQDVAQDRSGKAYAALERKLKAAEAAEGAEKAAREKAAAEREAVESAERAAVEAAAAAAAAAAAVAAASGAADEAEAAKTAVDTAEDSEKVTKEAEAKELADKEADAETLASQAKNDAEEAEKRKWDHKQPVKQKDIEILKEIFLAVPNTSNRQDLMDALQGTHSADDDLEACIAKAREARRERKKAADEEKQAYDKLVSAKTKHRGIGRMKERIDEGTQVDESLKTAYNNQEPENKYSSLNDADWTLGMIVLHATGCTPRVVTKEGWADKAPEIEKQRLQEEAQDHD